MESDPAPGDALLLVARRSQLIANRISLRPQIIQPIASGVSIVTVDFDSVSKRVYWGDVNYNMIYSSFQNGTDRKPVSGIKKCILPSVAPVFFY